MKPIVLSIAGSDPSGGAGIQADQRVIESFGCASLSVPTALTSQNSQGVSSVFPVPIDEVTSQLETLLTDITPNAIKIGLLPSAQHVIAIAEIIRRLQLKNIVLDPVFAPTNGPEFLPLDGMRQLIAELLPLCDLITPNLQEASLLSGLRINGRDGMEKAASKLRESKIKAILIKGGHLDDQACDYLLDEQGGWWFCEDRVETKDTHGTGCYLSSGIASGLAWGRSLRDSVHDAKQSLTNSLANPIAIGKGRGYPVPPQIFGSGLQRLHSERLARLKGIYYITDHGKHDHDQTVKIVFDALWAGVKVIQLRDKHRPTDQLTELARKLRTLTLSNNALLIINDRVDIALASDADGVHLGPGDMHPRDARRLLGVDRLIGISASNPEEAEPYRNWASYIGCGAVFGTRTKLDAGDAIGLETLRSMKNTFPDKPIIAIGGISVENINEVAMTGAAGAAVVTAISCAENPYFAATKLLNNWQSGRGS